MPRKDSEAARSLDRKLAGPYPPMASELTPEERKELVRRFLKDPDWQDRAAQAMADGLFEDANA